MHAYDYRLKASMYIPHKRIGETESEIYDYIVSYYNSVRQAHKQICDDRHDELFHNLASMSDADYFGWFNAFKKIYSMCLDNNYELINKLSNDPKKHYYLPIIDGMYKSKEQIINRSLPMVINTVDIRVRSEKVKKAYENYIEELSYENSVLIEKMQNDLKDKYFYITDSILKEYLDKLLKNMRKDALKLAKDQLDRVDRTMKYTSYAEATSIKLESYHKRKALANITK